MLLCRFLVGLTDGKREKFQDPKINPRRSLWSWASRGRQWRVPKQETSFPSVLPASCPNGHKPWFPIQRYLGDWLPRGSMEMEVGDFEDGSGIHIHGLQSRQTSCCTSCDVANKIEKFEFKIWRQVCVAVYCFEATCSIFVLQASCFKEPMPIRSVQLLDPRYHLWSVNLLILQSWLYELQWMIHHWQGRMANISHSMLWVNAWTKKPWPILPLLLGLKIFLSKNSGANIAVKFTDLEPRK